jgi:hypothetical protein
MVEGAGRVHGLWEVRRTIWSPGEGCSQRASWPGTRGQGCPSGLAETGSLLAALIGTPEHQNRETLLTVATECVLQSEWRCGLQAPISPQGNPQAAHPGQEVAPSASWLGQSVPRWFIELLLCAQPVPLAM